MYVKYCISVVVMLVCVYGAHHYKHVESEVISGALAGIAVLVGHLVFGYKEKQ